MSRLMNLPGTRLEVDLDFMSHLIWHKGYRDKLRVNQKYQNFLRRLIGIKPVRSHLVADHDWFCGWHDPYVECKINGRKHRLYYHSNVRAERIFNYLKDYKNHPGVEFKEPKIPLKDYWSYDT